MGKKGKLIIIDGLDGCGKSTQFELLINEFNKQSLKFKSISFPNYNNPSSVPVKMYLNGEISSNVNDINAYAASSFYAVDRYISYKKFWENDYNSGNIILASRYTTSNAIHQMEKIPHSQWDNYLDWLQDYEYNKLGLPKPDCVIFLDMPIEISQRLLSKRYNGDETKKDIHESNVQYLYSCRKSALYAAEKLDWHIVNCSKDNEPLSVEIIYKSLSDIVFSYIK